MGFSSGIRPGLALGETGCVRARLPSPSHQAVSYFQGSLWWPMWGDSRKHIVLKSELGREEMPGMDDTSVCLFAGNVVWGR